MSETLTAIRTLRIDPDLWEAARVKAKAEQTSVSAIVREALRDYAAEAVK